MARRWLLSGKQHVVCTGTLFFETPAVVPTIQHGRLTPPLSCTLERGRLKPPLSSTLQHGRLKPPLSSTLQHGRLKPPLSSTPERGRLKPPLSSTLEHGRLKPPLSSPLQRGRLKPPLSSPTEQCHMKTAVSWQGHNGCVCGTTASFQLVANAGKTARQIKKQHLWIFCLARVSAVESIQKYTALVAKLGPTDLAMEFQ